jgi:hypothetical protein
VVRGAGSLTYCRPGRFEHEHALAKSIHRSGDCRFYKSGDLVKYNTKSDSMPFVLRKDS